MQRSKLPLLDLHFRYTGPYLFDPCPCDLTKYMMEICATYLYTLDVQDLNAVSHKDLDIRVWQPLHSDRQTD